jgi:hypothetical protein
MSPTRVATFLIAAACAALSGCASLREASSEGIASRFGGEAPGASDGLEW